MEARNYKMREYNTDIFNSRATTAPAATAPAKIHSSHHPAGFNNPSAKNAGLNDRNHAYLQQKQNAEKPSRTSFQDSNIFGYKEESNVTWQDNGRTDKIRKREGQFSPHKTQKGQPAPIDHGQKDDGKTMHAQEFVPLPVQSQAENQKAAGTKFGREFYGEGQDFNRYQASFDLSSSSKNWMTSKAPNRHETGQLDAHARKQAELGSDWNRNTEIPQVAYDKARHQDQKKDFKIPATMNWKDPSTNDTRQNVKPGFHDEPTVNTFQKRQEMLESKGGIFEQTDYKKYAPTSKNQKVDEEVQKRVEDRNYSDLYDQTGQREKVDYVRSKEHSLVNWNSPDAQLNTLKESTKVDATARERKQDFLNGNLSTADPNANPDLMTPSPTRKFVTESNKSGMKGIMEHPRNVKQSELSSQDIHRPGFYNQPTPEGTKLMDKSRQVLEFDVHGLNTNQNAEDLKGIAGVKHVVGVSTEVDNIKNICTGHGKISIRLADGETVNQVRERFEREGLQISNPNEDFNKKDNYTDLSTANWRDSRTEIAEKKFNRNYEDANSVQKVGFLESSMPITESANHFQHRDDFMDYTKSNQTHINNQRQADEAHSQSLSTWNNMGAQTRVRPQTAQVSGGMKGYMRGTKSFENKSRR